MVADAIVVNEILAILIRRYSVRMLTAEQMEAVRRGAVLAAEAYTQGEMAYKPTTVPPHRAPVEPVEKLPLPTVKE